MAVGDWHEFADGYGFRETLHGPNVEQECVDCQGVCYSTPRFPSPRCEMCSIVFHGAMRVVDRLLLHVRPPSADITRRRT